MGEDWAKASDTTTAVIIHEPHLTMKRLMLVKIIKVCTGVCKDEEECY